ncbi:Os12g0508800 [Oryza sativa Japonica Group]|uniref:Os12g0508800 protein n=1 Tax=Oryza sativa subsp. japonica TaxID=39947 RepID=A0A0P0YB76_ORYSJ|nr:Os12g0508800 [Oryza sativa Japonica Group]
MYGQYGSVDSLESTALKQPMDQYTGCYLVHLSNKEAKIEFGEAATAKVLRLPESSSSLTAAMTSSQAYMDQCVIVDILAPALVETQAIRLYPPMPIDLPKMERRDRKKRDGKMTLTYSGHCFFYTSRSTVPETGSNRLRM